LRRNAAAQINSPNGDSEYDKSDAVEGKFAFNANDGGEHRVCFTNNGEAAHAASMLSRCL
jgi:hypothetical protein